LHAIAADREVVHRQLKWFAQHEFELIIIYQYVICAIRGGKIQLRYWMNFIILKKIENASEYECDRLKCHTWEHTLLNH
jgi:hypothetical protein